MSRHHTAVLCFLMVWLSAVPGCTSKSNTEVQAQTTSVGQQLEDLDRARQKGLITEKEYEEQRKIILKNAKK